jgi:hypothetical protein
MVLTIEECNQSIQYLQTEYFNYKRQKLRHSKSARKEREAEDKEKLDQTSKKIQEKIEEFQKTLNVLNAEDKAEEKSCFIWSEKKITAFSTVAFIGTSGGAIAASFDVPIVKWIGVSLVILAAGAGGLLSCYSGKQTGNEKRKAQLQKLCEKGLEKAQWLLNYIQEAEEVRRQEEANRELRHNFKKIEKRLSQTLDQIERSNSEFQKVGFEKKSLSSDQISLPIIPTKITEQSHATIEMSTWDSMESAPSSDANRFPHEEEIKPQIEEPVKINQNEKPAEPERSKLLDKKITQFLSCVERMPEDFKDKKNDDYLQALSFCILRLPSDDPIKQTFERLSKCPAEVDSPSTANEKDSSPENKPENILKRRKISFATEKDKKNDPIAIAQDFEELTTKMAERFKIRREIREIPSPNGGYLTSRGTVRLKKRRSQINNSRLDGITTESTSTPEVVIPIQLSTEDNKDERPRKVTV